MKVPAKAALRRSYGDPVLERKAAGRHCPGHNRTGVASTPSLPPSCDGVSYTKQSNEAHIRAWDSARTNGMVGKSVRTEETITSPELAKGCPVTESTDGCGSLGLADGAQGALIQPEWIRGCEHT
jgi:hypothetical protein